MKYTIPEKSAQDCYLLYGVKDNEGKVLISFYTNKNRQGKFYYSAYDKSFHQTEGTLQFNMPEDKNATRAKLRRMAKTELKLSR